MSEENIEQDQHTPEELSNQERLEALQESITELQEKLAELQESADKTQQLVEAEIAFGMHDTDVEPAEGELTWDQYIETVDKRRKATTIHADEKSPTGYRREDARFASEKQFRNQDKPFDPRDIESQKAVEYKKMGVMALAKAAAEALERDDIEDYVEIDDLAKGRIEETLAKDETSETQDVALEETKRQRFNKEDYARFRELVERFSGEQRGAHETKSEGSEGGTLSPEDATEPTEESEPTPEEDEIVTYKGEKYTVLETYEADDDPTNKAYRLELPNGETMVIHADDLDKKPSDNPENDSEDEVGPEQAALISAQEERFRVLEEKLNSGDYTDEARANIMTYVKYQEKKELERGALFESFGHFRRFDELTRGAEYRLEVGAESGFEQGQLVKYQNGDVLQDGWVFLGVDPETGEARLGRQGDNGEDRETVLVSIDALREAQVEGERERRTFAQWYKDNKDYFGMKYWAARWNTFVVKQTEAPADLSQEDAEKWLKERKRRNIMIGAGAVVAVGVGAYLVVKYGMSHDHNSVDASDVANAGHGPQGGEGFADTQQSVTAPDVANVTPDNSVADVAPTIEIAPTAGYDVPSGGGGIRLFEGLGIKNAEQTWYQHANELLTKFPDSFYQDGNDVRISRPGVLPDDVRAYIESLR